MKSIRLLGVALGLFGATSAFALTPNTAYTVKLSAVSSAGQLSQVATMAATADSSGRVAFSFSNVPSTGTNRFLMVQVVDGNGAIAREGMVAAPAAGGNVTMGVSEVTDKQAKAMIKTMADAQSDDPGFVMMLMSMVRSGAITDTDAQGFSPLAQAAKNAFDAFMTTNGVTAAQMTQFKSNLLTAMQSYAGEINQSVAAATPAAEADARGDAIAQFMDAMVNAGANAGISANLMPIAFDAGGAAAETAAGASSINAAVITAMQATFRTGTQQRQVRAEMRRFADSMPVMAATTTQVNQFTTARTQMGNAMLTAQENFEQMFADPAVFPSAPTIASTETTMLTAMQTAFTTFLSSNTAGVAASSSDISTMLGTMATRMSSMGGMMGGMTSGTLSGMGIGMMVTTPGSSTTQNWTVMMVSTNNFVVPGLSMTYTPSTTTLAGQLTGLGITPPTAPTFSSFADPYKSMLELQYDLMLAKLINLQKVAQIGATPTQAQLATIKGADLATKAAIGGNIAGLTSAQATALMVCLAQPQML
ncbi:MAG TPA: hypothetical protein VF795_12365 [Desulfuromonadaceae bacterium]